MSSVVAGQDGWCCGVISCSSKFCLMSWFREKSYQKTRTHSKCWKISFYVRFLLKLRGLSHKIVLGPSFLWSVQSFLWNCGYKCWNKTYFSWKRKSFQFHCKLHYHLLTCSGNFMLKIHCSKHFLQCCTKSSRGWKSMLLAFDKH